MNAISASKPQAQNRFEGFALTAIFQGLPIYATVVLLLKLSGTDEIVGPRGGAAVFVLLTSMLHGVLMPWLGLKFPRIFGHGFEPLFFDSRLSLSDKIVQWRNRPATSTQLVATVLMLSLLAVVVASMR